MKYRIIHEIDGNNKEHWEVQFFKKHWYNSKWKNTKTWSRYQECYCIATYTSYDDAKNVVKELMITRTVCDEGEVNASLSV